MSAEEREYKDTDTFELFKKDLDKVLEKHYPNTDYQWDYLDDHWIELRVWLIEPWEVSDEQPRTKNIPRVLESKDSDENA